MKLTDFLDTSSGFSDTNYNSLLYITIPTCCLLSVGVELKWGYFFQYCQHAVCHYYTAIDEKAYILSGPQRWEGTVNKLVSLSCEVFIPKSTLQDVPELQWMYSAPGQDKFYEVKQSANRNNRFHQFSFRAHKMHFFVEKHTTFVF